MAVRYLAIDNYIIPSIEKALGFKLYDDQIKYLTGEIKSPRDAGNNYIRGNGKTTAYCIRLALSYGEPLRLSDAESFSDAHYSGLTGNDAIYYSKRFFVDRFMTVRARLEAYGFPVRDVWNYKQQPKGGFIVGD